MGGAGGEPLAAAPASPREVAFASGACLAVPRAEWERLGGFPADYFMYYEDVDLSLRVRLRGGRVGIEPAARVDHDYEFGKGELKWRLLERNRWATILRMYPGALLALLAPALLATELALLAVAPPRAGAPQARGGRRRAARAAASAARAARDPGAPRDLQRRVRPPADARPVLAVPRRGGPQRGAAAVLRAYWAAVYALLRLSRGS